MLLLLLLLLLLPAGSHNWSAEATGSGPAPFSPPEMRRFSDWLLSLPTLCGIMSGAPMLSLVVAFYLFL